MTRSPIIYCRQSLRGTIYIDILLRSDSEYPLFIRTGRHKIVSDDSMLFLTRRTVQSLI